jgi:hypothetical protein
MKQRTLSIAQLVERALTACYIGMENYFDLSDELLKTQVDWPKQWSRFSTCVMDLLPTSLHSGCNEVDSRLTGEGAIQCGTGFGECVPNTLRPVDRTP